MVLAETHTSSLGQTGSYIFWESSDIDNHIVIGADASNAISEAPVPKEPLCIYLNAQFREWWKSKGCNPFHPSQKIVRVKKALQGCPKSP